MRHVAFALFSPDTSAADMVRDLLRLEDTDVEVRWGSLSRYTEDDETWCACVRIAWDDGHADAAGEWMRTSRVAAWKMEGVE